MPFAARKKIINVSTVYADEDRQPPRSTKNRHEREDYTINAVAFAPDGGDMTDAATDYLKQHVVAGNGAFAAASPGISTYPGLSCKACCWPRVNVAADDPRFEAMPVNPL